GVAEVQSFVRRVRDAPAVSGEATGTRGGQPMSRCAYTCPETGWRCLFEASAHSPYCRGCESLSYRERHRFETWMREVVVAMETRCGLHPDDLPDCPYTHWHATGMTPEEAAREYLGRFLGNDSDA